MKTSSINLWERPELIYGLNVQSFNSFSIAAFYDSWILAYFYFSLRFNNSTKLAYEQLLIKDLRELSASYLDFYDILGLNCGDAGYPFFKRAAKINSRFDSRKLLYFFDSWLSSCAVLLNEQTGHS